MSEVIFAPGQRWVSNSEVELGLGIVKEVSGRRISLLFPAAAEERTYASDNAPLSRVIYKEHDQICNQEGVKLTVIARQEINDCLIYLAVTDDGTELTLHEMDLASEVQFRQPQDRLFAGQIDKNREFDLRLKTLEHHHRLQQSAFFGLSGGRVQLLPHQLYIASQVGQRYAPRVLLADEVGLGKTIEAGLIMHQLLLTGRVNRVLLMVPDSLLHQWLVEMLRRFNLQFTVMDQERFSEQREQDADSNPFEASQLILASVTELANEAEMRAAVVDCDWDMLVIDEAHHLQWSATQSSAEYLLAEQLAAAIESVLLLTATPEQLGVASHFARLRLLDPQRYFDLQLFTEQEQNFQTLSGLLQSLEDCESAAEFSKNTLLNQLLTDYFESDQIKALQTAEGFAVEKKKLIADALDRHGTGRLLFRNTRDTVSGFPERICHSYALAALTSDEVVTDPLMLIQSERLLGEQWLTQDARVAWLVDWLKQHRQDKVLLICARAETAIELEQYFRVQHGCRSAVFHEQMTLVNRDRAAAYFAEEEQGAQILFCSETGSEGRNFQFCQHLVMLDLPLSADLLEQRIGRLDRIGQKNAVQIHVPYHSGSAQQRLFDWYHQGLNAFEQVATAASKVSEQLAAPLREALLSADSSVFECLLEQARELNNTLTQQLGDGRNWLLERNSFNAEIAASVIEEIESASRSLELADYMDHVFSAFGVDQQTHSSDSIIIMPGDHMIYHDFPALPEDGLTATFHRHKALSREDLAFLSWEHPMVLGAMDLVMHNELGNTAFCTLASERLPVGSLLLEAVFVMRCAAPRHLQIGRYLPENYLRLLIDQRGRNHAESLDALFVSQRAGRIAKNTAQQLVSRARTQIQDLISHAQRTAVEQTPQYVEQAKSQMHQQLESELQRMQQLARVNPDIRPQELDYLAQSRQSLEDALTHSQLLLDAIRVIIVTEPS